jgi:hypothetical protein
MPSGGRRENSGRPKGSTNVRHRVKVEDNDRLMPVEWMLAVLRDPETEELRRDRMAEIAAPYLHPRLAVAQITTNGSRDYNGGGDVNITQVFCVPRGGRLTSDGTVMIDGEVVTELPNIEPYTPTPPLELTDQSAPAPIEPPERLEVLEVDTTNVTPLRRRDETP